MGETLTTMLSEVTIFIGSAFEWVSEVLETVTSDPVVFIYVVAVPLVGLGVGLLKRLIKV